MKTLLILIQIIKVIAIIFLSAFFLFSYLVLILLGFFINKEQIAAVMDDYQEKIKKLIEL